MSDPRCFCKARDALAKEEEATMAKFGCPIKRAEKNFYECLARFEEKGETLDVTVDFC